MSYILDALKRADAERERGAVPGLHARQLTSVAPKAGPGSRHHLWLGIGAVALVVGAGLWVWHAPAGDARQTAAQPPGAASLVPPTQTAPLAALPASASTAPLPVVAPPAMAASAPVVNPVVRAAAAAAPAADLAPLPASKPQAPVKAADAAAPSAPVALLGELPEELRRQIPAITITGAVYSEHPGQRMLLVNAQVLKQGSLVGPELTLEEIRASSSVFSFRGTRFRVAH
jgi:general secretion pathway protein B